MARRFIRIGGALAGLVVLAIVALVAITLLRSDDPNLRTEAPAIPTTAAPAQSGTDPSNATAPDLPSGVLRFVIDSAGSEAKYVVRETLRGVIGSNAVGTTNAITGAIYLTPDGLSTAVQSEFNVDLRELRSDESRRDRYVRNNVLDTRQFPFARLRRRIHHRLPGWLRRRRRGLAYVERSADRTRRQQPRRLGGEGAARRRYTYRHRRHGLQHERFRHHAAERAGRSGGGRRPPAGHDTGPHRILRSGRSNLVGAPV